MKTNKPASRWVFKKIRPYISGLIVLIAIVTLMSYVGVQFSLISRSLIDTATKQSEGNVAQNAVLLVFFLVLQLLLRILYIRIHIIISGKLSMSIRTELFYRLMKKEYRGVTKIHSGEMLNRLISDVTLVSEKMTELIPNVIALGTTVLFSFVALYQLDKQFACLCLGIGPLVLAAAYIYRKKIKDLHLKCRESDGKVRSFLQESIQNFLIVKAFGREDMMRTRSYDLQTENYRLNVKRATVGIMANVLFFIAMTVGYYAALAWSVYRLSLGLITFGTVTAILGLVGQLQSPFREIAGLMPQYYIVMASAERLMDLENLEDETKASFEEKAKVLDFSSICVENVHFSYDDVLVLNGVNFTVEKGALVALCGNSGAGKSTFSKLLLSVISPDSGNVFLSLSNGETVPLSSVTRSLFSYVPQGNMILSGTIRDNITFGEEHPDEARVKKAASLAQLSDVVESLPNGLDTVLGEKGHGLSEGQIQRIAIARALYFDAPVLLLDEATSSLDIATENAILTNIKRMTDKTCIIISHRKEVMQACDKTYILQNGTLHVL